MFVYEGDAPLAERRAQALSLDSALLAELLGATDLRELLDAEALAAVEAEIAAAPTPPVRRPARTASMTCCGRVGDLTTAEAVARGATAADLESLEAARRAIRVRIAGEPRWLAIEDAGRVRDALGAALPVGVPEAFTEPVRDPLGDLVSRYARTHGPFHPADVAERLGLGVAVVATALARLAAAGRVVQGEFRPGGAGHRVVRRRGPAGDPPPLAGGTAARGRAGARGSAGPLHPGVAGRRHRGPRAESDGVLRAVEQLAGVPLPASALESLVLPAGSPTTRRRCSTSSRWPARCSGPAPGRCRATTAGSCSPRPTSRR